MANFLAFPDTSQLSSTDNAKVNRLLALAPTSIAGKQTFSSSSLKVPSSNAVSTSGLIAPTGIQATGSTFAFVIQGNFAFTSTGNAITIHWDGSNGSNLLAIRRADGSNYSITAGSMTIGGLTAGTQYGFSSFVAVAQPQNISWVQGDSGQPGFAFSPSSSASSIAAASRTQRLTTNESITVGPIYFTANVGASGLGTGTYTGQ